MEKRLFLAFFITLVFLLFWGRFMAPAPNPQPTVASQPDNLEPGYSTQTRAKTAIEVTPEIEIPATDLPEVQIGNLFVKYSATGGYIESIAVDDSENVLPFRKVGYIFEDIKKSFTARVGNNSIIFEDSAGAQKEFIFDGHSLEINITPTPPPAIVLFQNQKQSSMLDQRYQEIFYARDPGIQRANPRKMKPGAYENVSFAGGRERYYCFSLLKGSYAVEWVGDKEQGKLYLLSPKAQTKLYIGPQTDKALGQFELQSIIYYGFFHAIGMLMIKLLYFFYSLVGNWGLAIIVFAVAIYACLFPFTMKSTKAMRKMQEIQPELEALKKKYKDNPQKFGKEQIELFKKYKVNPIGGCLPLFFQFPIFIALYQVLFRFVELKGASFLWIRDLSLPDRAFALPFKIPILGSHINLLPILIMLVGLIQQKITISKASSSEQKSMGLFFSVFLGVIFYNFPSALVLYWFIQNLLTFSYQLRISKTSFLGATTAN